MPVTDVTAPDLLFTIWVAGRIHGSTRLSAAVGLLFQSAARSFPGETPSVVVTVTA